LISLVHLNKVSDDSDITSTFEHIELVTVISLVHLNKVS